MIFLSIILVLAVMHDGESSAQRLADVGHKRGVSFDVSICRPPGISHHNPRADVHVFESNHRQRGWINGHRNNMGQFTVYTYEECVPFTSFLCG